MTRSATEAHDSANTGSCVGKSIDSTHLVFCIALFVALPIFYATVAATWDLTTQLLVCLPFIGTVGIAHGANDHYVLSERISRTAVVKSNLDKLGPKISKFSLSACAACYLSVGALTGTLWYFCDYVLLAIFLTASAFHFGGTEIVSAQRRKRSKSNLCKFVVGAIPVVFPFVFQTKTTMVLFRLLLSGQSAHLEYVFLFLILFTAIWVCAACFVLSVLLTELNGTGSDSSDHKELLRIELFITLSTAFLFSCTPPVIAFATYFCAYHSIAEIRSFSDSYYGGSSIENLSQFINHAKPTLLASIFLVCTTVVFIRHLPLDCLLSRTIFVGLACLTMPHLVTHSTPPFLRAFLSGTRLRYIKHLPVLTNSFLSWFAEPPLMP